MSNFPDSNHLDSLNPEQREAVTTTEGYVRVIAGAGSGKTRALSHRFAYLVQDLGILPGNILCATFTSKAANEMRQRIHALTGDRDTGYVNTFHGFCVSVLQEDIHIVQYPKSFLVLDNADIDDMLRTIYDERGLSLRDMTFGQARDMFEIRKLFKEPGYYHDLLALSLDDLRAKYEAASAAPDILFYGYLYQQKKCFGLDYNDLIVFTLHIFEINAEVRLKWQKRLEYIMVDEFQDIDALQYRLMKVLCDYHKNLFIVGDPDQTIYTWRGADVKFLLDFDKEFPGTKTILMTRNYRSTPQILAVVNSLVSKNRERIRKDLVATQPDGPTVLCHHAPSARDEADWIAKRIRSLHDDGTPFRDVTLLYRAHYVTRAVEDAFLREKIPYTIYSGVPFFGRKEIKDALAYLRLVAFRDDLSFRRICNVPKRNLGIRRMRFLEEKAAAGTAPAPDFSPADFEELPPDANGTANPALPLFQNESAAPATSTTTPASAPTLYQTLVANLDDPIFRGTKAAALVDLVERFASSSAGRPVSEVLAALLDESGYEAMLRTEGAQDRLDDLAELKQSIHEYETTCGEECTLEHYLSHVAFFTNADAAEEGDKVKLMTIHAAKGLEFPYVFLCGMNEGVLPSRKTDTEKGMEEERRLAFVAMTRARRGLRLSEAEGWTPEGAPRYPSRFLLEIDPELLEFTAKPSEPLLAAARDYIRLSAQKLAGASDPSLLAVGQRVRHPVFGSGVIEDIEPAKAAYLIRFESLSTPRSISFRAKLEPLPEPEG